jgi:hypothetical protein
MHYWLTENVLTLCRGLHSVPLVKSSSKSVALAGVFAALHATLYIASFDLWRSWSIYLMPLEGIILGPWVGLSTAFIGSIVGRMIKPIDLWMFGIIAEPLGAFASGLLAKKQWKLLMAIYGVMLTAYFVHPLGRELPLWTILDILLAFILIYPATKAFKSLSEADVARLPLAMALISYVGIATDALTRVFLFVPLGFYAFLMPLEAVYPTFVAGAIDSFVEDVLVVIVSSLLGTSLLLVLRKIPGFKYPLS